jgi:hypothetical protein
MDPAEITRFVELMDIGFDFVRGSRMITGGSSDDLTLLRRFGNWFFRTLTNGLTGSRYTDLCYGYFAVRRDAVELMDLRADGFEIETELNIRAHRAGLRTGEVPSSEYPRKYGTSQLNTIRDGFRILSTIFATSLGRQPRISSEQAGQRQAANGFPANVTAQVPISLDSDRQDGQR